MHDYSQFVGTPYQPPHGCFRLVARVYRECYGVDIDGLDAGVETDEQRLSRLHEHLTRLCHEVPSPKEGDVVLVRSMPWHMGVAVSSHEMLHSYAGGDACIERINLGRWQHRIEGFYRYVP